MTRNLKWGYWPAAMLAAAVLGFAHQLLGEHA